MTEYTEEMFRGDALRLTQEAIAPLEVLDVAVGWQGDWLITDTKVRLADGREWTDRIGRGPCDCPAPILAELNAKATRSLLQRRGDLPVAA